MVLVISHEGNRDILILVESGILKVKQITGLYHEAQNIYINISFWMLGDYWLITIVSATFGESQ